MTKLLSGLVAAAFTLAFGVPATAAVTPRLAADAPITQVQQTDKAPQAQKKAPAKQKAAKKPAKPKKQTAKKPAKKAPAKSA